MVSILENVLSLPCEMGAYRVIFPTFDATD